MAQTVALIMAGGGGARLWPASTAQRPKQLIPGLAGDPVHATLLQATAARVSGWADRIMVVTTRALAPGVAAALPRLEPADIIVEPQGCNTAPCVALAVQVLLGTSDPDCCLAIVPADHHVRDGRAFLACLDAARAHALCAKTVATLGITPDHPATGYGYLERAEQPLDAVAGDDGQPVFAAIRFVEKPDARRAAEYLASGRFLWNAGIFVATLGRLAADFRKHATQTFEALEPVRAASASGDPSAVADAAQQAYAQVVAEPIDTALMEKLDDIRVVPADLGWTDLGSWRAVAHALGPVTQEVGKGMHLGPGRLETVDTTGCLVWTEDAENEVGLVGCEGLAVIVSGKSVLVCPLDRAQEVRVLSQAFRKS